MILVFSVCDSEKLKYSLFPPDDLFKNYKKKNNSYNDNRAKEQQEYLT